MHVLLQAGGCHLSRNMLIWVTDSSKESDPCSVSMCRLTGSSSPWFEGLPVAVSGCAKEALLTSLLCHGPVRVGRRHHALSVLVFALLP